MHSKTQAYLSPKHRTKPQAALERLRSDPSFSVEAALDFLLAGQWWVTSYKLYGLAEPWRCYHPGPNGQIDSVGLGSTARDALIDLLEQHQ